MGRGHLVPIQADRLAGNAEMKRVRVRAPIFIIGSGRSGTTLIYDLLATHGDVAWFSNWTKRYPRFPELALLSRLAAPLDIPVLTRRKFWPAPTMEANNVHKYCGFYQQIWEQQRAITADDVPESASARFVTIIEKHLQYQGKKRFLHKNVNNSMRIPYLQSVFPDAKFIHVVRDGRAVALSLLNVAFWQNIDLWWTDASPQSWAAEGRDPLLLCGLNWQREVEEILAAAQHLTADQYFCIRYEDFVADPLLWLREMVAFSDLEWDPRLEESVARAGIRNLNDRWRTAELRSALADVEEVIADTLRKFDYPV